MEIVLTTGLETSVFIVTKLGWLDQISEYTTLFAKILIGAGFFTSSLLGALEGSNVDTKFEKFDTSIESEVISCREACEQWENCRLQYQLAEAKQNDIKTRCDMLRSNLLTIVALDIGLITGGIACLAVPSIGWLIATPFWLLFIATSFYTARNTSSLIQTSKILTDQMNHNDEHVFKSLIEARKLVLKKCDYDQANACLSRSSPA